MSSKKQIVLGVTGSIAAYKACDIIRRLQDRDFRVSVVMTEAATQLISSLTLASLSGEKVHRKMFDQDQNDWQIGHICLAQSATAVLVAPATANIIGKIASGIADDFLTAIVMATKAPVFIAPAMNSNMYSNPIVQENCKKLRELGYKFIEPKEGNLACGDLGVGPLANVDDIVKEVSNVVSKANKV